MLIMNINGLIKFALVVAIAPILYILMVGTSFHIVYANSCQAYITSDPIDADVYIDGRLLGKTPYLHFVGIPFTANITLEKEGYETWTAIIDVALDEHKQVNAVLKPLEVGAITVTKTVTTSVTLTNPTKITTTTTATSTTTETTSVSATVTSVTTSLITSSTTFTVTSTTTEPSLVVTSEVTKEVGLPAELSYGAIGVAAAVIIASLIIGTRKKS